MIKNTLTLTFSAMDIHCCSSLYLFKGKLQFITVVHSFLSISFVVYNMLLTKLITEIWKQTLMECEAESLDNQTKLPPHLEVKTKSLYP